MSRGVRLGSMADGVLTGYLEALPSVNRKCAPLEVFALLECPEQIGDPANINTSAPLGFSVMGYQ